MKTVSTTYRDNGVLTHLSVNYGLSYHKGNSAPHFSITADETQGGRMVTSGCQHELILKHFPDLEPLIKLHLSDREGVPMHCIANGMYFLEPAGISYCVSIGKEPLRVVAEHFRCGDDDAQALQALVDSGETDAAKTLIKSWRDRYKAEADAAIAAFGLEVPAFPVDSYVNPLSKE